MILCTGILASLEIAQDLLKAYNVGEEAYQNFKKDCLENDSPTAKFRDEVKKQLNLKTFSHKKKKYADKDKGKQSRWSWKLIETHLDKWSLWPKADNHK